MLNNTHQGPSKLDLKRLFIVAVLCLFAFDLLPFLLMSHLGNFYLAVDDLSPAATQYISGAMRHRPTVGQPASYRSRVLLFGNSAMAGSFVSDADTIASQLQKLLPDILVENYGIPGGNIAEQLLELQDMPLRQGDVIVFYEMPELTITEYALCGIPVGIVQIFCAKGGAYTYDLSKLDHDLKQEEKWIGRARSYAEQRGLRFVYIWQPTPYSMPMTATEKSMIDSFNEWLYGIEGHNIVDATQVLPSFETLDRSAVDFTHILDAQRARGCQCFYDAVHTTPEANRITAHEMYNVLFPTF